MKKYKGKDLSDALEFIEKIGMVIVCFSCNSRIDKYHISSHCGNCFVTYCSNCLESTINEIKDLNDAIDIFIDSIDKVKISEKIN